MINAISKNDKRIFYIHHFFYNSLNHDQKKLYKKIDNFLKLYSKFNYLNKNKIVKEYFEFIDNYIIDCKNFNKTEKYPYQINKRKKIKRISYELALIISCLLTPQRFSIMEEIYKLKKLKKTLFIGAGTGLEIYLIKDKLKDFIVYDISSSKFIYEIVEKKKFKKKLYNFSETKFDTIFTIEFLEHLKKPYKFLKQIYLSMKINSQLICTTAKNIPQFDHLYNFKSSIDFEKKVKKIGFKIIYSNKINHQYDMRNIKSNNVFYILKRS